jgi:hypothetical protein
LGDRQAEYASISSSVLELNEAFEKVASGIYNGNNKYCNYGLSWHIVEQNMHTFLRTF